MTWVKLCGMTRRADIELAASLGADAVGFIAYAGSPRAVSPEAAAELGRGLEVLRYLVTVDLGAEDLLVAARTAGVDGVQPHGEHKAEAAQAALEGGYRVLFPVPVREGVELDGVPAGAVPILDTATADLHGGTGRSFDWALAAEVVHDYVLAGGLTPETVADAVARLDPWGVDVASGIEAVPGEKDAGMMERFMENVR
jgi:phosphoribosylanthranilate isomerase